MEEHDIELLKALNKKNITKEEYQKLYNIPDGVLKGDEDYVKLHLLAFAENYNLDISVVEELRTIYDESDLFAVYFYIRVIEHFGSVNKKIIEELINVRCVSFNTLFSFYSVILEYVDANITMPELLSVMSSTLESWFEKTLNMSENARRYVNFASEGLYFKKCETSPTGYKKSRYIEWYEDAIKNNKKDNLNK